MEDVHDRTARVVPAALDRELQLVREAIALVAGGGARRVTLAGLRFGNALVGPGSRLALEAGVRVTRLPTADDARVDLAVEQIKE
jgi:hypothetical protein